MDDRQLSLGLPPASNPEPGEHDQPIPPTAATPRQVPHAYRQLATQAKGLKPTT
jgi:hypothetical protein